MGFGARINLLHIACCCSFCDARGTISNRGVFPITFRRLIGYRPLHTLSDSPGILLAAPVRCARCAFEVTHSAPLGLFQPRIDAVLSHSGPRADALPVQLGAYTLAIRSERTRGWFDVQTEVNQEAREPTLTLVNVISEKAEVAQLLSL